VNGVVLVTGVMAAGKSTVAQALAEEAAEGGLHGGRAGRGPGPGSDGVRGDGPRTPPVRGRPGAVRRGGGGAEAAREQTGYGAAWTGAALDAELRARAPRIGLWPDTAELTVGETVEAIPAGRERARVA
jgi:Mrp family chromosome partitioning ATPase